MTFLRKILTTSFTMFLAVSTQVAVKTKHQQVSELNLNPGIPQALTPVPDEMAKVRYPSENRPRVIYGNECSKAFLDITIGRNTLSTTQLDMAEDATLKVLADFDPQAEPVTVDGHKAQLITFRSRAPDTKIPNMLLIIS